YLKKGSSIIVTGEMSTELWTDREGRQHIQHNVIADSIKFSPFGRSDRMQEQMHSQGTTPTGFVPSYTPNPEMRSHTTPNYRPPQPQAFAPPQPQPFNPAPIHDFSFGEPSEALMHSGNEDEPPF